MKQSKTLKFIALMAALVMITSVFVSNTMSKFVTGVNSTDSARVAVWGINGGETQMNLFATEYIVGNKIVVDSNDGDKIMAPGTFGEAPFSIINFEQNVAPEVAYTVSINLDDSNIHDAIRNNSSIQWRLDDNAWGTIDELKTSILSLAGNATGVHTYGPGQFATAFQGTQTHKISWQWLMDNNNNELDTQMGNLALTNDLNAVIKVSITAEQTDDLVTNENILDGANQVVNMGDIQPLTIRSASDISNFQRVEVNGQPLTQGTDYTVTSGSTVITLKSEYLAKLGIGRYNISIVSTDMVATTVFNVVNELDVSDILAENSWETISKVVEDGNAAKYWSVGDKTTVDVNGTDYEVAIAGIDHDGDNTVTFVFLENIDMKKMNSNGSNSGSWKNSDMRKVVMPEILAQMENKEYIKEVKKQTIKGYSDGKADDSVYDLITTNDKLFLLSYTEVFGDDFNEGVQYEYFKNPANRVIEPGEDLWWWLRTPSEDNLYYFYFADEIDTGLSDASASLDVVPAFVIGDSVSHSGVIPKGGTYYQGAVIGMDYYWYYMGPVYPGFYKAVGMEQECTYDEELNEEFCEELHHYENDVPVLVAGDKFPEPRSGDVYVYGDYEYRYDASYINTLEDVGFNNEEQPFWVDGSSLKGWSVATLDNSKSKYGDVISNIAGEDVKSMNYTFYNHKNLIEAPEIPDTVIETNETFTGCDNLK